MAKQTTKTGLLQDILVEHRQLEKNLAGIPPSERTIPGVCGEWSVKDILAHLAAWEQLFMGWYQAGLRSEPPAIPAPGYSWQAMHQLNAIIYTNNRQRSLEDVQAEFATSYQQVLALVHALPEEEIFTPGRYAWTGHLRLVEYIAANTCSHYRWAKTLLRQWVNNRKVAG